MSVIAVFAGDFHSGSSLGLQPPVVRLDDGQILRHSRLQAFIWSRWMVFWNEIAAEKARRGAAVVFFANGELVDDNWHKTPQMASRNLADLMKLALQAFVPARRVADEIVVMRGTEAHSGGGGALDELMAERLAARRDAEGNWSRYGFYGEIENVYLDVRHHPGHNALRPWTHGGHVNRLAADMMHQYWGGAYPPQLVVRGHIHTAADSADNFPIRAVILPSWKLSSRDAWGQRFGGAGILPIGGMWGVLENGTYDLHKRIWQWPIEYRQAEHLTPGSTSKS